MDPLKIGQNPGVQVEPGKGTGSAGSTRQTEETQGISASKFANASGYNLSVSDVLAAMNDTSMDTAKVSAEDVADMIKATAEATGNISPATKAINSMTNEELIQALKDANKNTESTKVKESKSKENVKQIKESKKGNEKAQKESSNSIKGFGDTIKDLVGKIANFDDLISSLKDLISNLLGGLFGGDDADEEEAKLDEAEKNKAQAERDKNKAEENKTKEEQNNNKLKQEGVNLDKKEQEGQRITTENEQAVREAEQEEVTIETEANNRGIPENQTGATGPTNAASPGSGVETETSGITPKDKPINRNS